ncbi:MAG TPA: thiamine phosphate synthase, partial [Chthoniobacterales bacterium]|nr:thiamine phosphate synthase [Chthoniobacterales bacterium]
MSSAHLSRCRLYAIVDLGYVEPRDALATTKALIAGGVDLLQLRAKQQSLPDLANLARELHTLTRDRGVPLIVNDHPEIARDIGAEGVHVGQDDLAVAEARAIVGANCMVGKST